MSDKSPRYLMNVMDNSYFSGKLETYFRFCNIRYDRREPTWTQLINDIYPNTGTLQVPTVYDRETKEWYRDTTEIILKFEFAKLKHLKTLKNNNELETAADSGSLCILPNNPIHLWFSLLLEDFFDEWLWRPALYYRWHYETDIQTYTERFLREFLLPSKEYQQQWNNVNNSDSYNNDKILAKYIPKWLIKHNLLSRQQGIYIENDGIKSNDKYAHLYVQTQYIELLEILNDIFSKQNYLFYNDYPCVADFGLMASMFRHFSLDTTSRKIMLMKAKYVYQWVTRMWVVTSDDLKRSRKDIMNQNSDNTDVNAIPSHLEPLLALCNDYLRYLCKNEEYYVKNEKTGGSETFDLGVSSKDVNATLKGLQSIKFRVYCRRKLQQRFKQILTNKKDIEYVESVMRKFGLWDALWKSSENYETNVFGVELPQCEKPAPLDWKSRLMLDMHGSPKWKNSSSSDLMPLIAILSVFVLLVFIVVYAVSYLFL